MWYSVLLSSLKAGCLYMKRKLREYFRQSSVWAAHQMLSPKSCFQCWLHMSLRGDSALFQGRLSDNSTWDLFCLSKDFLFVHLLFFSRWCFKALCSKYFFVFSSYFQKQCSQVGVELLRCQVKLKALQNATRNLFSMI